MPSYLENQDAIKKAGIDNVVIYSVNDGAVMKAWARQQREKANDTRVKDSIITFMGDPSGEFTRACGMELTGAPEELGLYGRCKRFAMFVDQNIVRYVAVSESTEDPAGDNDPSATCYEAMMEAVRETMRVEA